MSQADDIWRWSEELARDPSSLVFLRLGEALRRDGELALAFKVALRGVERHPNHADAHALLARITADYAAGRPEMASSAVVEPGEPSLAAPERRPTATAFSHAESAQTILVDGQGLVLAGEYRDAAGRDTSQELAAHLSGVSDEAARAVGHLQLGRWKSIVIETDRAVLAIAPIGDSAVTVVTASRAMPLGMLRRVLTRSTREALAWVGTP